ncbi:ankyrin repeat domain-containing protein [Legionella gresilensis]|uniref:ankyrin repeat domain-containing protein n=1 Tax=Legionella gresilensis TaxID=91823 RepID=UPI001041B875|nr:ankyrin repeat domain-containing protein [Legionella gresilensis]
MPFEKIHQSKLIKAYNRVAKILDKKLDKSAFIKKLDEETIKFLELFRNKIKDDGICFGLTVAWLEFRAQNKSNEDFHSFLFFIRTKLNKFADKYEDDSQSVSFSDENLHKALSDMQYIFGLYNFQGRLLEINKKNVKFLSTAYIVRKSNSHYISEAQILFDKDILSKAIPEILVSGRLIEFSGVKHSVGGLYNKETGVIEIYDSNEPDGVKTFPASEAGFMELAEFLFEAFEEDPITGIKRSFLINQFSYLPEERKLIEEVEKEVKKLELQILEDNVHDQDLRGILLKAIDDYFTGQLSLEALFIKLQYLKNSDILQGNFSLFEKIEGWQSELKVVNLNIINQSRDKDNNTVLHTIESSFPEIKHLVNAIELYQSIINVQNKSGKTPLHMLLLSKQKPSQIAEYTTILLTHGAQQLPDEDNNYPILLASKSDNTKLIKILMPYCSKEILNKENKSGKTPLWYAVKHGNEEAIELLVKNGAKIDTKLIKYVIEKDMPDILELLLKLNDNKQEFYSDPALLIFAFEQRNNDAFSYLIKDILQIPVVSIPDETKVNIVSLLALKPYFLYSMDINFQQVCGELFSEVATKSIGEDKIEQVAQYYLNAYRLGDKSAHQSLLELISLHPSINLRHYILMVEDFSLMKNLIVLQDSIQNSLSFHNLSVAPCEKKLIKDLINILKEWVYTTGKGYDDLEPQKVINDIINKFQASNYPDGLDNLSPTIKTIQSYLKNIAPFIQYQYELPLKKGLSDNSPDALPLKTSVR